MKIRKSELKKIILEVLKENDDIKFEKWKKENFKALKNEYQKYLNKDEDYQNFKKGLNFDKFVDLVYDEEQFTKHVENIFNVKESSSAEGIAGFNGPMGSNKKKNKIKEGKWDHDFAGNFGGNVGSFSKYSDGTQSVVFFLGRSGKWEYEARLSNYEHAPGYGSEIKRGIVPDNFQDSFNEYNQSNMTRLANIILKNKIKEDLDKVCTKCGKKINPSKIEYNDRGQEFCCYKCMQNYEDKFGNELNKIKESEENEYKIWKAKNNKWYITTFNNHQEEYLGPFENYNLALNKLHTISSPGGFHYDDSGKSMPPKKLPKSDEYNWVIKATHPKLNNGKTVKTDIYKGKSKKEVEDYFKSLGYKIISIKPELKESEEENPGHGTFTWKKGSKDMSKYNTVTKWIKDHASDIWKVFGTGPKYSDYNHEELLNLILHGIEKDKVSASPQEKEKIKNALNTIGDNAIKAMNFIKNYYAKGSTGYGLNEMSIENTDAWKEVFDKNKPEDKDINRLKDIISKSQGLDFKAIQLANNMAKAITSVSKSIRRARASELLQIKDEKLKKDLYAIFIRRAMELAKQGLWEE